MTSQDEIYVTSRSRAPSIIDVKSQNERVFSQLPDLIQEAAVSIEISSPNLIINRAHSAGFIESKFMTQPMFFITPTRDSGISLPDLNVTDEKFLAKYGLDLSANFADIKRSGAKAFVERKNISNNTTYSLCTCATGYIWVSVRCLDTPVSPEGFSDHEIQIGTFALKARAITTVEIPFQFYATGFKNPAHGQLAFLFSTVVGKYLQARMVGQQYESATENATAQTRKELSPLRVVDPGLFKNFHLLLKEICTNAPLPPTSVVSLISRNMITSRWTHWKRNDVLRRRYFLPGRVIRSFQKSRYDAVDLLSGRFTSLPQGDQVSPQRRSTT